MNIFFRDGDSRSAPLIGNYTGTDHRYKTFFATGSSMFITFVTDHSVLKRGFKAYLGTDDGD